MVELMPSRLNESCRNDEINLPEQESLNNLQAYGHSMQWTHRFALLFQVLV